MHRCGMGGTNLVQRTTPRLSVNRVFGMAMNLHGRWGVVAVIPPRLQFNFFPGTQICNSKDSAVSKVLPSSNW